MAPRHGTCHFKGYLLRYTYCPARPGCMYQRNGDPGDPPEPAEVYWTFHLEDGTEVPEAQVFAELSEDYTEEQIVELSFDAINESEEP